MYDSEDCVFFEPRPPEEDLADGCAPAHAERCRLLPRSRTALEINTSCMTYILKILGARIVQLGLEHDKDKADR